MATNPERRNEIAQVLDRLKALPEDAPKRFFERFLVNRVNEDHRRDLRGSAIDSIINVGDLWLNRYALAISIDSTFYSEDPNYQIGNMARSENPFLETRDRNPGLYPVFPILTAAEPELDVPTQRRTQMEILRMLGTFGKVREPDSLMRWVESVPQPLREKGVEVGVDARRGILVRWLPTDISGVLLETIGHDVNLLVDPNTAIEIFRDLRPPRQDSRT